MGFILKYHRSEDRMTIGFVLPDGEKCSCWLTRRQWLSLILRVSKPDDLPKRVLSKEDFLGTSEKEDASQFSAGTMTNIESPNIGKSEEGVLDTPFDPDNPAMVKNIVVFQMDKGVRVSFILSEHVSRSSVSLENWRVNLTFSPLELENFERMLRLKAKQVGWDLEAGLDRLNDYVRSQRAKSKRVMH